MVKLLQNKSKYIKKNITGSPHTIWKKSWLVGDSKALSWLPYSGKLSREKTSANFIVLWFAKVFFIKFGGMAKVSNPRKFSPWKSYFSPICESFFLSKVFAIQYTLTAIHHSLNSNYRRSGNFRCKNIFVVCANHKKKTKHEIYFTTDNHYSQNIFVRTISPHSQPVISRETVSSIPACHSSSWQTRDNFSLSVW